MIVPAGIAERLTQAGIVYPVYTIEASEATSLPLALLCAVLEQETGGGHNVFGHDRVTPPQIVGGRVTRDRYRAYKRLRATHGCQGVGPMQLTFAGYQDAADRRGGCWRPSVNILVGAEILARAREAKGTFRALAAYNGSTVYTTRVMLRLPKWRRIIAGARDG